MAVWLTDWKENKMRTSLRDKPTWLHDLVHDDMELDTITKGFIKFYVLQGLTVNHVQQDIHFRVLCGEEYIKGAMERLRCALEAAVDAPDRSEMRTLKEVQMIVDAVREGVQVQIDYYDPEIDDDPYVARPHW